MKILKSEWKQVEEFYLDFNCPYCGKRMNENYIYDKYEIADCEIIKFECECISCEKIFELDLT